MPETNLATRKTLADTGEPNWFRAALSMEPKRHKVAHQGAELELLTWGPSGAPGLLLLHGFRAQADWWSHIAPMLAVNRRVAAVSWSGMGRSEWRNGYDFELYASEAMAAADAAGLWDAPTPPAVIAHSFGGHVGTILAARQGHLLGGVIMVDGSIKPKPPVGPLDPERRVYQTRAEVESRLRLTPPQSAPDYVMRHVASHAVHHADDGWTWHFDPSISSKLQRDAIWNLLPQAQCRLAFVRGELSALVTERLEDLQRQQAPTGTLFVTIPDAAHHILLDQPLSLVSVIRAMLAGWESVDASAP